MGGIEDLMDIVLLLNGSRFMDWDLHAGLKNISIKPGKLLMSCAANTKLEGTTAWLCRTVLSIPVSVMMDWLEEA